MRKALTLLAVSLQLVVTVAPAAAAGEAADANIDILRETIRTNRKALVAVNLKLTDEEAKKFWPVYDDYVQQMKPFNDRLVKVIEEYTAKFETMTDDDAMKIVNEYLSEEVDRAKLRQSFVPKFAAALPGRKVARFYQIENKMDAVLRFELAANIPVMKE